MEFILCYIYSSPPKAFFSEQNIPENTSFSPWFYGLDQCLSHRAKSSCRNPGIVPSGRDRTEQARHKSTCFGVSVLLPDLNQYLFATYRPTWQPLVPRGSPSVPGHGFGVGGKRLAGRMKSVGMEHLQGWEIKAFTATEQWQLLTVFLMGTQCPQKKPKLSLQDLPHFMDLTYLSINISYTAPCTGTHTHTAVTPGWWFLSKYTRQSPTTSRPRLSGNTQSWSDSLVRLQDTKNTVLFLPHLSLLCAPVSVCLWNIKNEYLKVVFHFMCPQGFCRIHFCFLIRLSAVPTKRVGAQSLFMDALHTRGLSISLRLLFQCTLAPFSFSPSDWTS